jgi:preprotein translocase subunit SecG
MQTVLIVVHLLIVIALVGTVLLQRSEGGALGVGGGGGFMTGRGQANALTRATAILAGLFFLTSLALTLLANLHRNPQSIFDTAGHSTPASQPVPAAPAGTSVLDQINQLQQQKTGTAPSAPAATPAAPSAPAPSTPVPAAPATPEPPKSQ